MDLFLEQRIQETRELVEKEMKAIAKLKDDKTKKARTIALMQEMKAYIPKACKEEKRFLEWSIEGCTDILETI